MKSHLFPVTVFAAVLLVVVCRQISNYRQRQAASKAFAQYRATEKEDSCWRGGNANQIPVYSDSGQLILYGHDLVANTSRYLGPKGTVAHITNGMNCQNCHLEAGTVPFGNNYGKVFSTYPQFRARNNGMQTIYDRVNDCLERSLNGQALDSSTHEMQAIYAYMKWLGEGIPRGGKPAGTSLMKLKYLDRAASPAKGQLVFADKCQSCHGAEGEGHPNAGGSGYIYPPLWGPHSYNDGAGLYRLSNFAGFVKNNMPFGTANYHSPVLTDEEAWDVAAFINSQPRPHKDQQADWHNPDQKPIDFPFGPYTDSFSVAQHKYGPFEPIAKKHKS